jgi:hypothetical protein
VPEEREQPGEPEAPRLRIRRGAELPQEFHYSREERLARPDAPRKREPQKGFFHRNRRFIILFGNIVLLFVLVILLRERISGGGGTARIGVYSLTLQGLRFGDTVYATLTVRDSSRRERKGREPAGRVSVRFSLEPAGEAYPQSAALPQGPGEEVAVGEAIPLAEGQAEVRELRAEVSIGGETRSLRRTIKQ